MGKVSITRGRLRCLKSEGQLSVGRPRQTSSLPMILSDILMSYCTFYRFIEKCLRRLTASDKQYLPYLYVLNGNF